MNLKFYRIREDAKYFEAETLVLHESTNTKKILKNKMAK